MLQITQNSDHDCWTLSAEGRANGIGTTIAGQLLAAVEQIEVRTVPLVLTAKTVERPKGAIWVAGGDLVELKALTNQDAAAEYARSMSLVLRAFRMTRRIVITAVDGAAIGGGAELAITGDLRFATARSSLEFKQLKVGLATGYGSARRMTDLVGLSRSEKLLLLCEKLSAQQSVDIGLMHEVLSDQKAMSTRITEVCAHLNTLSPEALSAQKAMLRNACDTASSDSARGAELTLFKEIWMNDKHAAFLKNFGS